MPYFLRRMDLAALSTGSTLENLRLASSSGTRRSIVRKRARRIELGISAKILPSTLETACLSGTRS